MSDQCFKKKSNEWNDDVAQVIILLKDYMCVCKNDEHLVQTHKQIE